MPMIARPFSSLTLEISPTSTPAMFTVWPWPGVTAWAVASSASTSTKSLPRTGTPRRQREPLVGEDDQPPRSSAMTSRTTIAMTSRRCLRIARVTQRVLVFVPNGRSFLRSSGSACLAASAALADRRRTRGGRAVEVRRRLRRGTCAVGRYGGRLPGYAGRLPSGTATRCRTARRVLPDVDLPSETRLRAAAGLEAHVHAVAVEVLALAGEPDQRVEELLVVLLAGRELVLDHDVAGRQEHVARAARRQVGLRQQVDRACR